MTSCKCRLGESIAAKARGRVKLLGTNHTALDGII
jgi:hypothetical protein